MQYKNVLFDLGNVLIDIEVKRSLKAFAALIKNPTVVNADCLIGGHASKLVDQYQLGAISTDEFLKAFLTQCKPGTTPQDLINAWYIMLMGISAEKKALLQDLVASGKDIYVLSNSNELHVQWVQQHCPELEVVKKIFYSNEMHLSKPDPRCYEMVIKETGIKPEETVYVDDLLPNIEVGWQLGFQCLHAVDDSWVEELRGKS